MPLRGLTLFGQSFALEPFCTTVALLVLFVFQVTEILCGLCGLCSEEARAGILPSSVSEASLLPISSHPKTDPLHFCCVYITILCVLVSDSERSMRHTT